MNLGAILLIVLVLMLMGAGAALPAHLVAPLPYHRRPVGDRRVGGVPLLGFCR